MPEVHALLSASASGKWLNCPPSARLEAQFPDSAGEAAAEGTLAHAIAELKLRKYFTTMKLSEFNKQMKKLKAQPLYQDEMLRYTDTYFDYLNGIAMSCQSAPFVAIEQQLDYSLFAPEGFGTSDCILIHDRTLWVSDLKYGKGVAVSAENNTQMMLYALGAVTLYAAFFDIREVVMAIVQPRLNSISEFRMGRDTLVDWGATIVRPAAKCAHEGGGECRAGDWCDHYFCRVRGQCRAYAVRALDGVEDCRDRSPALLDAAELGELLTRTQFFDKWRTVAEDFALKAELSGRDIPGWKAVEGRSTRQFTDPDAAFDRLKSEGIDEAVLYERKPLTLAATEKLVGKPNFDKWMTGYVTKPRGKPALVPDSDSRPMYNPAEIAFGNLKGDQT